LNWQQELAKLQRKEELFHRLRERGEIRGYQFGDPAKHVEFESEKRRKALVIKTVRGKTKR